MVKVLQSVLGLMLLMGVLAGCQSMTGQTAGEYIDDSSLTTAVKAKLTNQQVSSLTRVEVETVNGKVHLTGVVKSAADKAEAARLAKSVKGVKEVDNDLMVQPE